MNNILLDYELAAPFASLENDSQLVAERIEAAVVEPGRLRMVERAEMVEVSLLSRHGRLPGRPFVQRLASHSLYSGPDSYAQKALSLTPYFWMKMQPASCSVSPAPIFMLKSDRPYDLVQFLRTIMPRKRVAELYISLGYNKHGKTELYRDLLHHLTYSNDRFEKAQRPGRHGHDRIYTCLTTTWSLS